MTPHRYFVAIGVGGSGHCVVDTREPNRKKREVYRSDSKCEVIAEAQRRNGFSPVDGDEQTYAKQIGLNR